MVGWKPVDPTLRQAKMDDFIKRIHKSHEFSIQDVPLILQYDDRHSDLRPWCWPSKCGVPVHPDKLNDHRYTHYFKAPCCPCAFKSEPSSFTESKIGLAQTVVQPGTAQCLGQFVAVCATQECGYLVKLEQYFGHPKLMLTEYRKREKPIKTMDPFIFLTDDTEETIRETGFRQIQVLQDSSNNSLRGTNRLLQREDPENFLKLQGSLKKLLVRGLPSQEFWNLFIQCMACKFVMPRQYFPYYHPCAVKVAHRQLGIPLSIPPSTRLEETIDSILAEGDISDSDDDHPTIFAATSRMKGLSRVDPFVDPALSPELSSARRRA